MHLCFLMCCIGSTGSDIGDVSLAATQACCSQENKLCGAAGATAHSAQGGVETTAAQLAPPHMWVWLAKWWLHENVEGKHGGGPWEVFCTWWTISRPNACAWLLYCFVYIHYISLLRVWWNIGIVFFFQFSLELHTNYLSTWCRLQCTLFFAIFLGPYCVQSCTLKCGTNWDRFEYVRSVFVQYWLK